MLSLSVFFCWAIVLNGVLGSQETHVRDSSNKRLLEKFLSLHPAVQFMWGVCVLALVAGVVVVFVVVGLNPVSVGSITSLATTVVLLFRGGGGPPPAATLPPH